MNVNLWCSLRTNIFGFVGESLMLEQSSEKLNALKNTFETVRFYFDFIPLFNDSFGLIWNYMNGKIVEKKLIRMKH